MVDIKELIDSILNKTNTYRPDRVYKDEPIIKTASELNNLTPPRYRQMRKIAKSKSSSYYTTYYYAYETDPGIFYEQGKFMEDYEDDFEYSGEFIKYYPTYQSMSDSQLRGYFTWRTKVRKGVIEKTSLSFVYVYIYELLNQIGVPSPEEGFHILKNFWDEYKNFDERINHYIKRWLKDYVIYYGLDKSLLEGIVNLDPDNSVIVLNDYKLHSHEDVFNALNSFSSYNIENSRFYKKYPEDVKNIVYEVFNNLSEFFGKNRKNSLIEKLFGKKFVNTYMIFNSAVFYDRLRTKYRIYEINDVQKYKCTNGKWTEERYIFNKKNKKIGNLLKAIDYHMRVKYNFKSTLQPAEIPKIYREIILNAIDGYMVKKKREALPKIDIDIAKLQDIRNASLITQSKLIVDDESEVAEMENEENTETEDVVQKENTLSKDIYNLSFIELEFIKCLLFDTPYDTLLNTNKIMLSVIIDSINEKLFDLLSDTAIIYDDDKPVIISDYQDELKGLI